MPGRIASGRGAASPSGREGAPRPKPSRAPHLEQRRSLPSTASASSTPYAKWCGQALRNGLKLKDDNDYDALSATLADITAFLGDHAESLRDAFSVDIVLRKNG